MRGSGNIRLATLQIRSGRVGELEVELRALRQGNVDVGILQETKLTDRIHERQGEGYYVWATEAERRHRGRILVVWREDTSCKVEGIVNFGPNVESFLLTLGLRGWYVVGEYVPPHDAPAVHHIEQALEVVPKGT